MKIEFVKQETRCGCSIACIAMAMGKTYAEVAKDYADDFIDGGQELEKTSEYLGNAGFSIVHKTISRWNKINFAKDEMLKPFAPVHIVRTLPRFDSESGHLVIMDADGKLMCPGGASEQEVLDSYAITDVLGLYR